jgi:hypothetical protein
VLSATLRSSQAAMTAPITSSTLISVRQRFLKTPVMTRASAADILQMCSVGGRHVTSCNPGAPRVTRQAGGRVGGG